MNIHTRAVRNPPNREASAKVIGVFTVPLLALLWLSRTHRKDLFHCLSNSYPGAMRHKKPGKAWSSKATFQTQAKASVRSHYLH